MLAMRSFSPALGLLLTVTLGFFGGSQASGNLATAQSVPQPATSLAAVHAKEKATRFPAMPRKVVGGYLESWTPLLPTQVPRKYNVLFYAFAELDSRGVASVNPTQNKAKLIASIARETRRGRPVLLSIGGAGGARAGLTSQRQVNAFVTSVSGIINQYGFTGIDWDLETGIHGGIGVNGLVNASRRLAHTYGRGFAITMTPSSSSTFPAYQAVAARLRDVLTFVGFQFYNNTTIPTKAHVLKVTEQWMSAAKLRPDQWTLGFVHVDDWRHLNTPFAAMAANYRAVAAKYPTVRGAWTWGIAEKDKPTGYRFAKTMAPTVSR